MPKPSLSQILAPYEADPEGYSRLWRQATSEEALRLFLPFFPLPPCRGVDIGAGDGRDATFLAHRGYTMTAVEPSAALRRFAQQRPDANSAVTWVDDALPDLWNVRRSVPEARFRFALLSSVLMHVPEDDHDSAMVALSAILEPCGRVFLSLRQQTDPARLMFPTTVATLTPKIQRAGLRIVHAVENLPSSWRGGSVGVPTWDFLVLEKGAL